jgi:hypothetical protein
MPKERASRAIHEKVLAFILHTDSPVRACHEVVPFKGSLCKQTVIEHHVTRHRHRETRTKALHAILGFLVR